jgi:hypothetical protein
MLVHKKLPKSIYKERAEAELYRYYAEIGVLGLIDNKTAQFDFFLKKFSETGSVYATYLMNETWPVFQEINTSEVYSVQSLNYINKHFRYYYAFDLKGMMKNTIISELGNLVNGENRDFVNISLEVICKSVFLTNKTIAEEGFPETRSNTWDFATTIAYKIADTIELKHKDADFFQLVSPFEFYLKPDILSLLQRFYSQNR